MNTLQTIYNKLQDKTELGKHEVELALLDNIKNQFKSLQQETSKLLQIRNEFEQSAKKLKSFSDIVEEQSKRLIQMSLELESKTKELGIPTPKEVDFYINQSNDFIYTAKESRKKATI